MKKNFKNGLTLFCMLGFLVMPFFVFAEPTPGLGSADDNLGLIKTGTGLGDTDPVEIVGNVIGILLGFLGIIAVILILMAGFKWMTAAGDSGKIDEAKSTLSAAVIGLIIIMAAYGIANYVIGALLTTTGAGS